MPCFGRDLPAKWCLWWLRLQWWRSGFGGGIVPRYREILRRRQAGQEIERLTRVHAALEKEIAQLGEKVARAKGLLASAQPQPSRSGPEVQRFATA